VTEIGEAIEGASSYLRAHPDEARYTDSVAIATLETGLRVVVTGPNGEAVESDMVPAVGGAGSAPSPGWLLRAAQASCVATLLAVRAAMLGLTIRTLEVEVDSVSDDRGILGLDESVPAGPLSASLRVTLLLDEGSNDLIDEITSWAVDHCPATDALRRSVPLDVTINT
jgi:uncharacterized OsmC-like protein